MSCSGGGSWYQWEAGDGREWVKESECGANTAHTSVNVKMMPFGTIPGIGRGGYRMVDRVNSNMLYLIKNFCKCHSVSPPSTIRVSSVLETVMKGRRRS
jgi:hypothetical protein